jgi:hypothetical protein
MARRKKDWAAETALLGVLQQIATVCEQSATVPAANPRLKQFATVCNILWRQRPLQTTQNPVVEHKHKRRSNNRPQSAT